MAVLEENSIWVFDAGLIQLLSTTKFFQTLTRLWYKLFLAVFGYFSLLSSRCIVLNLSWKLGHRLLYLLLINFDEWRGWMVVPHLGKWYSWTVLWQETQLFREGTRAVDNRGRYFLVLRRLNRRSNLFIIIAEIAFVWKWDVTILLYLLLDVAIF